MIPFKTSFESTPTLRSSRHSLSNFSGVSLLSMLKKKSNAINLPTLHSGPTLRFKLWMRMETHPLTFLKIASFCPFSLEELASRLVLREGTHLWTLEPGVFPRNSLQRTQNTASVTIQKHLSGKHTHTSPASRPDPRCGVTKGPVTPDSTVVCSDYQTNFSRCTEVTVGERVFQRMWSHFQHVTPSSALLFCNPSDVLNCPQ